MRKQFEDLLIEQCAPTLAGLKPGSLFRVTSGLGVDVSKSIQHWERQLSPFGLHVTLLKTCPRTGDSMVYVYRQTWLEKILREPKIAQFLAERGYPNSNLAEMLEVLSGRYCTEREMPHEIGIFLGYPLEDVVGFIQNKGRNFTCCGCWKCYGDPETAQRRFAHYRRCTSLYQKWYQCGIPIIQLVTAA
jgi:hypothetical protein